MIEMPPVEMILPDWFSGIRFAFSLKEDGQMSFKRAANDAVIANRTRFLAAHQLLLDQVVAGELVHGSSVEIVTAKQVGRGASGPDWIPGVDGLVTAEKNVLLLTTHADCSPLVIYDPVHNVIGQAHAGWRGLRAGIVEQLVTAIRSFNGTGPNQLKAWIGPTVRACCYPVGPEVVAQFPAECQILVWGKQMLDLARFIRMELARLGFEPEAVTDSEICTSCSKEFSSFRRDGSATRAMALVTGLK